MVSVRSPGRPVAITVMATHTTVCLPKSTLVRFWLVWKKEPGHTELSDTDEISNSLQAPWDSQPTDWIHREELGTSWIHVPLERPCRQHILAFRNEGLGTR